LFGRKEGRKENGRDDNPCMGGLFFSIKLRPSYMKELKKCIRGGFWRALTNCPNHFPLLFIIFSQNK